MSDHDKFKDYVPKDKGFEFPVRAKMFEELSKLNKRYTEQAINEIGKILNPEEMDRFGGAIEDEYITPLFKQIKSGISLLGSDEVSFHGIFNAPTAEKDGKYMTVLAYLYKDGQPLPLVEGDKLSNSVYIAVSPDPEEPPLVFPSENYGDEAIAAGVHGELGVSSYKQAKLYKGEPVQELDDDQCDAILSALSQQELDIDSVISEMYFDAGV